MKNEIKRAFAMEVIEWIEQCENSIFALSSTALELKMLADFKKKIQSLLPKEEEVDWSKASHSELITEAKRRYPKRTVCKSASSDHEIVSDGCPEIWNYDRKSIHIKNEFGLLFYDGKWAEIVEPETKTESEHHKMVRRQLAQELKEHEETESDEVKDVITTEMVLRAQEAILANHRDALANPNFAIDFIQSLKQPTLEQKARKKAEEIVKEARKENPITPVPDIVFGIVEYALLIDPKTL